jgi:thiol-disulfide isomerase/thioredoxin
MGTSRLILVLLFSISMLSCENPGTQKEFDLHGQSYFTLLNETEDSLRVQLFNWYSIPLKSQEFDTTLGPNSALEFLLITQNNTYYDLTVDQVKYKIFSTPGSVDSMSISKGTDSIQTAFSGDVKNINEYLIKKSRTFKSVDADWMPRAHATSNINFDEVLQINDSITQLHLDYLDENKKSIPDWYLDFEKQHLMYLNAGWKINNLHYRKAMLGFNDTVPENFLENTIGSLPVSNEGMIGDKRYMYFLNDYFGFKTDPGLKGKSPNQKDSLRANFNTEINLIDKELSGKVKEAFLTFYLSLIIDHRRYVFDEKWLEMIQDEKFRSFLIGHFTSNPILPKGSPLPYFNLPDTANVYIEPDKYAGQILLINFWATWCKPCIKEFPHENSIVERFSGEPVKVLNICMESDRDSWKKMVKKHELKSDNILAQEIWNDKISRDFDINALPHSTLVDWNGKIVQNKCPRASENVDELISELLIKFENEGN